MQRDAMYFDSISQHFLKNIYSSDKGHVRMAVLKRDLDVYLSGISKHFLDVGGGAGQFSRWVASLGHEVTIIDYSQSLLDEAQTQAEIEGVASRMHFIQGNALMLDYLVAKRQFDGVFNHAVIEWVENSNGLIEQICGVVKPGGFISLMYYNQLAQEFMHHTYGNFTYINSGYKAAKAAKLTPDFALTPNQVAMLFAQHKDFVRQTQTGIRTFIDFMSKRDRERSDFTEILEKELAMSLRPEFITVSRYVHEIYTRKPNLMKEPA